MTHAISVPSLRWNEFFNLKQVHFISTVLDQERQVIIETLGRSHWGLISKLLMRAFTRCLWIPGALKLNPILSLFKCAAPYGCWVAMHEWMGKSGISYRIIWFPSNMFLHYHSLPWKCFVSPVRSHGNSTGFCLNRIIKTQDEINSRPQKLNANFAQKLKVPELFQNYNKLCSILSLSLHFHFKYLHLYI